MSTQIDFYNPMPELETGETLNLEKGNIIMSKLMNIPIGEIAQNEVALRNVDRQSQAFIGLRDSIANKGVMNSITVRPSLEGAEKKYELIDGLHRFVASQEAGLKEIPAQILTMTDAAVLEAQFVANCHKVKTKPVEYAKQIQRILAGKPTLTVNALASDLSVSPGMISERLGLLKLDAKVAALVDDGTINLSNAYVLAKLPPEEQANYLQAASTQSPSEFVPTVQARIKEVREAARAGRKAGTASYEPQARCRKRGELVIEFEKPSLIPAIIKDEGHKDPIAAAAAALAWVLQLDAASIAAGQAKYDQHQQQMEEAKSKRKASADKKKADKATEVAASVS